MPFSAVKKAEQALFTWAAKNPNAHTIPGHVQGYLDIINRGEAVRKVEVRYRHDPFELEAIRSELQASNQDRFARRAAEWALADYIEQAYYATGWEPAPVARNVAGSTKIAKPKTLLLVAQWLRGCRREAFIGQKQDGGFIFQWAEKCGQVRLCPDEAREETQRLMEWYLPALIRFAQAHHRHRLFYMVPTVHNYRPGDLARGKRELMDKWKAFADVLRDDGIDLRGSLNVQEDPLSAAGDWNVHLNVIACVRGSFDWDRVRELWGANIHIAHVKAEPAALRGTLMEMIKYAAQTVPEKSAEHADTGQSKAPAMTEWPYERWIEWWEAQQGFRRVRSYGCLYGLHEKTWNAAGLNQRAKWCDIAKAPKALSGSLWRDIPGGNTKAEKEDKRLARENNARKTALRRAMQEGERLDLASVDWVGILTCDAAGYRVGLITDHNFFDDSPKKAHNAAAGGGPRAPPW